MRCRRFARESREGRRVRRGTRVLLREGDARGTIDLGNLYQNFVLALKVGDPLSLYYFTAATRTVDSVTNGAGTNSHDAPQNLSHGTLYGGKTTSVPEPGMMLLLGTGLLGPADVAGPGPQPPTTACMMRPQIHAAYVPTA